MRQAGRDTLEMSRPDATINAAFRAEIVNDRKGWVGFGQAAVIGHRTLEPDS